MGHPEKLPKTKPSNPRTKLDSNVMTQSCPTPPQSRRKFFLSPKALRSPFAHRMGRHQSGDSAVSGKRNEILIYKKGNVRCFEGGLCGLVQYPDKLNTTQYESRMESKTLSFIKNRKTLIHSLFN